DLRIYSAGRTRPSERKYSPFLIGHFHEIASSLFRANAQIAAATPWLCLHNRSSNVHPAVAALKRRQPLLHLQRQRPARSLGRQPSGTSCAWGRWRTRSRSMRNCLLPLSTLIIAAFVGFAQAGVVLAQPRTRLPSNHTSTASR